MENNKTAAKRNWRKKLYFACRPFKHEPRVRCEQGCLPRGRHLPIYFILSLESIPVLETLLNCQTRGNYRIVQKSTQ